MSLIPQSMLLLYEELFVLRSSPKSKSMKQKFASFTPVFESPLHSHHHGDRTFLARGGVFVRRYGMLARPDQASPALWDQRGHGNRPAGAGESRPFPVQI